MALPRVYNVVVLGANVGGVPTAHYLLQHAFPALSRAVSCSDFRLVMISPSDHFYFKISTPRYLFDQEAIPISKLLLPIETAFAEYTDPAYTFIKGKAIDVKGHERVVEIAIDGGETRSLEYDILIISTGTTGHCLWSLDGDHSHTRSALEYIRKAAPSAKTILVAGGGPAGVEVAAEAKSAYPDVAVELITKYGRVLPGRKEESSKEAEATLLSLGVCIRHNLRVVSSSKMTSGQTAVKFDDGSECVVDIYIDGTGGRPNTSFIPREWLDENQRVTIDNQTQRVVCREADRWSSDGVYALGNVTNASSGLLDLSRRVIPLVCSVAEDLALRSLQVYPEDMSRLRQQIVNARMQDLEQLGVDKHFDTKTAKMVGVIGEWESIVCGVRGSRWKGRIIGNPSGSTET